MALAIISILNRRLVCSHSWFVLFLYSSACLLICTTSIPDIVFVYIKYIFVNYTDLLTTDFPRGCTNCEARISNFCCSTAWNGICCEFPLKKKQVSNKHSQNSTKQQKFHFTIANQSGPRLRWQMKICDDSWLVSDRTQIYQLTRGSIPTTKTEL